MKLKDFPVSKNIEDLREEPSLDDLINSLPDPKDDLLVPDKTLKGDPKGDIGTEMQSLRGYGKARQSKQWRVR